MKERAAKVTSDGCQMTIRLAICYNGAVELRKNRHTVLAKVLRGILSDWEDEKGAPSRWGPMRAGLHSGVPAMEEDRKNGNRA